MQEISLPHNYVPRDYQLPVLEALDAGCRRAVCTWHRRSGKDKTFFNFMVKKMFERVGIYYYFFPNYNQGKKILWDGIDRNGFKYLDHIPEVCREKTNNTEMKITCRNGSIFQVIGTDNIDSVMGTNPVGCVFSEFALQDPQAWDFVRPILLENEGWAVFNFTPRGRNHAFKIFQMAQRNPEWYCELLTVDDTGGVITPDMITSERESGMEEALIQQEYWCSFEAALQACFFADTLARHNTSCKPGIKGSITRKGRFLSFTPEDNGILELWRYPYRLVEGYDGQPWTYRYAVGTDPSEGLGQDYSVAYVYDRLHREIIARLRSNKIDAVRWADMVADLAVYYDGALVVPERNGAGITVVNRLNERKASMYVRVMPGKTNSGLVKEFGWLETPATKYDLVGALKEWFRSTKGRVWDGLLLDEASTFIKSESGRLEADEGFHDDCVIAAGLAIQGDKYLPRSEQIITKQEGWLDRLHKGKENPWIH